MTKLKVKRKNYIGSQFVIPLSELKPQNERKWYMKL